MTEVEVALRDGSTVHVRPVSPDDREAMEAFLAGLSEDSRRLRYFSAGASVRVAARAAVGVQYPDAFGLVAIRGDGRIVAHATYGRSGPDRAEVAFAVADELHGMGIATTLLAHLAEVAEEAGISWLEAEVLPENHRMVDVFRESGFAVETRSLAGAIGVEFPASLSPEGRRRFEERERTTAEAAMRSFLSPSSVAVIGASRRPGNVGHEVLRNLVSNGFTGPVYVVNPNADSVASMPAHDSIEDVPGHVGLAVIAVPAAAVVETARACAAKGVRSLVVLSAGFAEIGGEGAERQRGLVAVCRAAGMRLIGPNCLGIINTDPDVRLDATVAPSFPPAGGVGFLSQSGALGLAIIDRASALGLGLSSFVSNGNKADISGNDLLQYWEGDEATELIVLYLESFGNPRKFGRLARRIAARKPILAVKSGRSAAGAKATSSHTGAMVSASDVTVDALFRQAGVIRTDTLSELFDVVQLLSAQPVPAGDRVGIVTNAGGLGILCADACEAAGLEVPELPEALREELTSFLAPTASTVNPVDMIATASPQQYRRTVSAVARSGAVDAIVAIFVPPLVTRSDEVAEGIHAGAMEVAGAVPVLSVFASHDPAPPELGSGRSRVPSYDFPEEAARALAHAAGYGRWRARDAGTVPEFEDIGPDRAAAVISAALPRGPGWLEPDEVAGLLDAYGLPRPDFRLVRSPEEAGGAAAELGGAVALKAVAPGLVHKTDAGGVILGVSGADEARAAAARLRDRVASAGHEIEAYLVQAMAPPGVEMLVGVVNDAHFGPVVACGSGGTAAELIGDVAVRLTPVTDRDAAEMVSSLRTYPLLEGYRGTPPVDVAALEQVVMRLGALVDAHPAVVEGDLNPVVVSPEGALVLDARMRVEPPPPRRPWPALGS